MPAAVVVFVNWMEAGGAACAWPEAWRAASNHRSRKVVSRGLARIHLGRNLFVTWRPCTWLNQAYNAILKECQTDFAEVLWQPDL